MTDHTSWLQTGTTDPARGHRVGVTSDGAENAPRLRVTCGEDSQESAPPLKRRVETHAAGAQDKLGPGSFVMAFSRSEYKGVTSTAAFTTPMAGTE